MNSASDKWFKIYNHIILGLSASIVGAYLLVHFVTPLQHYQVTSGLNLFSTVIALVAVVDSLFVYPYLTKTLNQWMAALGTVMIFLLAVMDLLVIGKGIFAISIYLLMWMVVAAFSGVFGLAIIVCFNFLSVVFVLLVTNFDLSYITGRHIALVVGTAIFSIGAQLLLWRHIIQKAKPHGDTKKSLLDITGIPDTQKQSETIIESIGDGVVVLNKESKISLINSAGAKMTGWPIEEALGIDVNFVFKLKDESGKEIPPEKNPFLLTLKSETKLQQSASLEDRQKAKIIVSYVISPIIVQGSIAGVVAVFRDISAQRAAEKQRADFISTASHEMRTPVAAIEGYLSLAMNEKVSSIDGRAKDFLGKAHTSTQQLGKLFQDLLTSSKAEDGRLVNRPEVIEMSSYISSLSESFSLAAQKKQLLVEFAMTSDQGQAPTGKVIKPLYFVHVDPERLREVVTNIFDNAVKYTPAGKITIGLTGDDKMVHVFVKDTGGGIPAEDIPHLFQKFYRVDNSAVRTIGGTGLGLYICKKIIEMYNGNIWVESVVEQGSTFHIDLPRLTEQQASSLTMSDTNKDALAMPTPNLTL